MKLTAETIINSDRDTVWRMSQAPQSHARWDMRFTDIEYLPRESSHAPQRFRYSTRIGFGLAINGWGETVGDASRSGSALRFGSDDPKSLIAEGAGSWTYADEAGKVRFSTTYDYGTRYGLAGRVLDLAFRPLMIWATRWSFDRLRIWIEKGIEPATSFRLWSTKMLARTALALVWIYEGLVPKLLLQRADEVTLVRDSGLYIGTAAQTLALLGAMEILFGLWLLLGRVEKTAAILSAVAITCLTAIACSVRPAILADPHGGISKNLGLLACGAVVWALSDIAPLASRATPRGARSKTQSPFADALGHALDAAAPLVRAHMNPEPGTLTYQGTMTRVWRIEGFYRWLSTPCLWLGCRMHTLFPDTGSSIPFEISNRLYRGTDGVMRMTFNRTFHFPGHDRCFVATMRYDDTRGIVLDSLGRTGHLLVELAAAVEDGALVLRSRRQWLTPFGPRIRIRIPRIFCGAAHVREWQESENSLGIRVTISNPLVGPFFGYEGTFTEARDESEHRNEEAHESLSAAA